MQAHGPGRNGGSMRDEARAIICEDLAVALDQAILSRIEPLRGGRVLVTGGTGFVGLWLAEAATWLNDVHGFGLNVTLLARDTDVVGRLAPHLARRSDLSFLSRDVRDVRDLPPDVTWIIHAGATPDSRAHSTDPLRVSETITEGTRALLAAAVRQPTLDGFLNVSSGLVYGPQPETLAQISESAFFGSDPGAFGAVYSESKRMAEALCAAYANRHRIRVVTARPFAFLGPYQHLDRPWAINNFIRDGLQGGPIRILGDGETVRSYLYAADMAAWMLTLLAAGQGGEAYNVGSPEPVTLRVAAELVAAQCPLRPKIAPTLATSRMPGRSRFVPDVSRAGRLGLGLNFDLTAAIQRTVQWNAQ